MRPSQEAEETMKWSDQDALLPFRQKMMNVCRLKKTEGFGGCRSKFQGSHQAINGGAKIAQEEAHSSRSTATQFPASDTEDSSLTVVWGRQPFSIKMKVSAWRAKRDDPGQL